ncbi:MAG: sigma-70 family RNA polymerase sigma factor [Planctomycetes bacterium]|jgi:RNA polymerase sigma-70 factor (ECF subfamily)|nr:sigma-70 family RNA polymerase sigma factor [Planctomycetota bacterium]
MTRTSMDQVLQDMLDQRAWLEGLCNSLVRDRSQALDLAQETATSVLRHQGPIANLRAYVRRIAENHARQQLRQELRRRRRERTAAEAAGERTAASAHEVSEAFEAQRAVAEAVHGLAEPFRATVLLHHFEGRSLADIARAQQAPEGTVRWRLHKAHALLRERLQGLYGRDWKLAIVPLCTPGLGRTVSVAALAIAVMMVSGLLWLTRPTASATAHETAIVGRAAAGTAPAADDAAVVADLARTPATGSPAAASGSAANATAAATEDQRAVVRVLVVDERGEPVPGASLRFERLVTNGLELHSPLQSLLLPEARATADGRAVLALRTDNRLLADLPASMRPAPGEPWELAFRVRAPGHLPAERRAFVADGDDCDLGSVRVLRAAKLRGRVVASDGSAIGGARVGVFAPPLPRHFEAGRATGSDLESAIASAETASLFSRGRYTLAPAPRGPVLVVAVAEGHRSATRFVEVIAAEQDVGDLVLEPVAPAEKGRGLVVQVVDEHGAPVAGAVVTRKRQRSTASSTAGPDGIVRFGVTVRDGVPDHSPSTIVANDRTGRLQSAIATDVAPTDEPVTLTLRQGRVIEVVVRSPAVAAGDLRAAWDAVGPIEATMWLAADGDRVRFAPPPFAARLRIARDRCVPFVSEPYEPDAWPERIEVTLVERTALHGVVLAAGQPVEGAQVLVLTRGQQVLRDGYRMGEWAATGRFDTRTDARGRFALSREQKEAVRCLVQKEGHAPAVTEPVRFDPGTPMQLPPIVLGTGGTVRGHLRTAAGAPVARAVIALHHPLFGPRTMLTARDGSFVFEHVAPGGHELRPGERPVAGSWTKTLLDDAAQQPFAIDAVVREGEVTEVEVVADACRLALTIAGQGIRSLAGWTVELRCAADQRKVAAAESLPVGDDGAQARPVHFAVSRAGSYELVLRAPGGPFGDVVVTADVVLAFGENQRTIALALLPWQGTLPGLGPATHVQLVQRADGLRIEALGVVEPNRELVTCVLAPVGEVEVVRDGHVVMRLDTRTAR